MSVAAALATLAASGLGPAHDEALTIVRRFGTRPAASAAERRMHAYAARRMRAAGGLRVVVDGFPVPGRGRSRNVVGIRDTPARCLDVLMAHGDSATVGRGALDNASGVGVVLALAATLPARTRCDVWLVVTGAEERIVTGTANHLGASELVRMVRREGRAGDLRLALSLDEVGRGRRFTLRSNAARPRARVEGRVSRAGARVGVPVVWSRDTGEGNSDHREFQLAGLPAAVMQVWQGAHACRHTACDQPRQLDPAASARARRVAAAVIAG